MMDMLMGPAAVILLLFLVASWQGSPSRFACLGARATRGDHPGERGYDRDQHRPN